MRFNDVQDGTDVSIKLGAPNFISKTPRELNGNSATITFGAFNRDTTKGEQLDTGSLFGINATHARAVNERWAYKISAGGYTQDAFARPTGTIPNGLVPPTPYPNWWRSGSLSASISINTWRMPPSRVS